MQHISHRPAARRLTSAVLIWTLLMVCAHISLSHQFMGVHAADGRNRLTVYAYDSFAPELIKSIKSYLKKNSDIEVVFRTFEDTGFMYSQLLSEKKKPQADVVIGLDNIYMVQAKKDGLLQPYKPKAARHIKPELIFDQDFYLTPFDYGLITFCYDSEMLQSPPKTWEDLLKPSLASKIVIQNPLTSSPGQAMLFASIAKFGESKYLDFWRKLKPNLLTLAPSWSSAYGMFTNGEVPLVLSYGTSPVYHLIYEKSERYKALLLEDAAWAQIEGVGILAGSTRVAEARIFVEYVLGAKFQRELQESQFMYPVRGDVALSPNFRVAVSTKNLLNSKLSLEKIANNKKRWLDSWESVMLSGK